MQKIIFIIDRIEGGGAEKQMLKVIELYNINYEIIVTSLHEPSGEMKTLLSQSSCEYMSFRFNNLSDKLRIINYLCFIFRIRNYIKKEKVRIVFSYLEWSNVLNIISNFKLKTRTFLNVRNHLTSQYKDKGKGYYRLSKMILKYFYNKSECIICNSQAIKEDLKENYFIKNKINVFYNIYDLGYMTNKAKEYMDYKFIDECHLNAGKVFLTVGRLVSQKNLEQLIITFSDFNRTQYGVNDLLVIVGSGPLESKLKHLVKDLSVNVIFIGHISNPYPLFIKCDYFILNSKFEGFPNVLSEAIILNCFPIVVDCFSGPREIISNFEIIDYKTELKNVECLKSGILYKKDDSLANINLFESLVLARVNFYKKTDITSKLKSESFGKDQWSCLL
ncbi:glycosyltransferase [uncultured Photobacterium sp.]|uniref:glycosyltransferase n=1 Tax=uncultured Photobacterium sp. TaxID=173973 RepID=UPI002621B780|nr:glycosyltransferase [uncultured Photobacterium sp.]